MAAKKMPQSATNPFYPLLIVAGLLFVLTAFGYFTMALRESGGAAASQHGLTNFLASHGLNLLIVELVVLGIATLGAIGTDDYWQRRARRAAAEPDADNRVDSAASAPSSGALPPSSSDRL